LDFTGFNIVGVAGSSEWVRCTPPGIDDEGLSARIGADHLGHSHVSMTQDRHMTRGRIHTQVADLLDPTVRINDEKTMTQDG
jgi:hypothetical protein